MRKGNRKQRKDIKKQIDASRKRVCTYWLVVVGARCQCVVCVNVYKKRVEILEKKVINRENYLPEDLEIWSRDKMKLFELEEDVMGLMELYKTMKNLE